jgi:tetratricopeptide (TPR) repeat protein
MSEAVKIEPESMKYRGLRGRLYNLQKKWRAAIRDFDSVLVVRPNAPSILYSRGRARFMIDDLDGAFADFERCIALQPGASDAWVQIGNIHRHRRDWEQAIRAYERAIELEDEEKALLADWIVKMKEQIWLRDNGQLEHEPSQARTPTAARFSDRKKAIELSDELHETLKKRRQFVTPYKRKAPTEEGGES